MALNQFTSQLSLRSYETESASHSHDFAQFVLPLKGILELKTGCHLGLVNANTAAFIAPQEQHCFSATKENLFLVVDLAPSNLALNLVEFPSFLELTPMTTQFLHFTQNYLQQGTKDLAADYLVQQLLFKLLSQPRLPIQDRCVHLAKHWIDNHFAMPINISKLAQHCHLSTSQLQRRFKRDTGQGLAEYWRERRLQHAKLLLRTEQSSIESIAYQVGYENLSAFSRRFSYCFGLSPSQWREMTLAAQDMPENDKSSVLNNC